MPDHAARWRSSAPTSPIHRQVIRASVPDAVLRRIRSAFLVEHNAADVSTEMEFSKRDQTVTDRRDGEYVLWFEADLSDQLQLIQILARLRGIQVPPDRITLICIGEYPGIAHFGELAELTSEQLGRLPRRAATGLTSAALQHATRAWAALRAPDPLELSAIAIAPSRELRFVAEAFDRLSREYPSIRDGLSLTERRILAAIGETGTTAATAFARTSARETRPFLGDTWCFDAMTRLLNAPIPLLGSEGRVVTVTRHTPLRITDAGRRVLDGREDYVTSTASTAGSEEYI
jgi:hypothetical protein